MNPKFHSPLLVAFQAAILSTGSTTLAATWTGTDNAANNFNTAGNWDTNAVPGNTTVVVIGSGATVNSTGTFNRAANTTLDGSLTVSNNGHFNLNNGSGTSPTFTVGNTGSLTYSRTGNGSQYFIGSGSNTGTFNQNGGSVNVTINRGFQVSDGVSSVNRTGTFNINGGTFNVTIAASDASGGDNIAEIYGGFLAGRAGGTTPDSFNVAGGTANISAPNSATRKVTLTNGASANVSSGSLTFTGFQANRIGYDDGNITDTTGTISKATVSGGSLTFAMGGTNPFLDLGATANYHGAINITGGALNVTGGALNIGAGGGNGNVTLAAGDLTVSNFITIGRKDSTSAGGSDIHLTLNGGTLSTSSIRSGGGVPSATNNNVVSNGGTIKALADEADFLRIGVNGATNLNTQRTWLKIESGGLTFDTNGHNVGLLTPLHTGDTAGGGLTKTGSGTLTLSGANDYTGTTSVNNGTLRVITGGSVAGACTVANGATLAADGNPWDPAWTVPDLTLANGSSIAILNFDPSVSISSPAIQATASLVPTGTVGVSISGILAVGEYPLIGYPSGGSIGGSGFAAFQLAPLPGVEASLVNDTVNSVIVLKITKVDPLVWKGNTNSNWDINTTTNWLLGSTPAKYLDGNQVVFNDSATGGPNVNVTLNATVSPRNVTFDNSSKNYVLSGSGSIGGTATIAKSGTGTVTLLTANTATGTTTVDIGTLQLGDGSVNGSLAGPLVNNSTVIFHPATASTLPGTLGGFGTFIKNGTGTQIITSPTNDSTGLFQVAAGTLQFGNGSTNISPGFGTYDLAAGATLRLEQATATTPPWFGITGAGNIVLNSAQPVNASAGWGTLNLPAEFTGALRIEKGRVDATSGKAAIGSASKVQILAGAQFLAFASTEPYTAPIEIAGTGWGENGYPCALRLAADRTATWAGPVTLTADSGIMAQRNTNFTVTGAITGAYQCEFYSGDPVAETGNLIVAPTVPGQNTYASTKINGRPAGSVTAGSDQAFSTGSLVVDNAILKLNGHNLSFASLAGAGGAIGNYSTTTPTTLTVGSNNADSSYAGVLRDGAVAPLALTKTGTGALTLTAAQSYTGNTTVEQGKLALANSALADASTVTINSGAVLELTAATSDTVGTLILGGTNVGTGTFNASHPVYGAYFAGNGSIVVGGGYDSWASSKGLSGNDALPESDPDKDGMPNLTEFYLDGNPLASDPSILPAGSLDATYLTFTFHRRDDAEASMTTQALKYGASLGSWTDVAIGAVTSTDPNGVIVTVVENDAAADLITVQVPRTLATSGKLFGRLQLVK